MLKNNARLSLTALVLLLAALLSACGHFGSAF